MSPLFEAMYSTEGRPSIPPETLLKASLLMALYSVRSERLFCEQLDYNLMFRYFLEMSMVEDSFNHSTFSKNRERLLKHEVAKVFFGEIVSQVQSTGLMSDEHLFCEQSADGPVGRLREQNGETDGTEVAAFL